MTDTSQFRSVLRGYDPAQVDHVIAELAATAEAARQEAASLSVQLSKLEAGHAELTHRLAGRERELAQAQRNATATTFAGLGERVGSILTLADEEAAALRAQAADEAAAVRSAADQAAAEVRTAADRYAGDVRGRADADSAKLMENARRKADDILDHADREASARREEAEALYEHQRAAAAESAAEFETTLASRRDKAASDFAAAMAQHESSLSAIQDRAATLASESERAHQMARSEAAALLENAREEAADLVGSARAQADRIKRDSDRELAAATARRDSITAQLTNVRQMLATLGGAGAAMVPTPVESAPAPALLGAPEAEADAEGDAEADAEGDAEADAEGDLAEAVYHEVEEVIGAGGAR